MVLRLYDTLSREKRVFTPLDPDNVRMYVCGPTVYDFAHIGNARPVIVFDVLFRLLRHIYGAEHVTYVRNITDVDDKINERALRDFPDLPLNDAIRAVTEKTANQFQADVAALGCLEPTHQPRATDFVLPRADGKADMVTLIAQLIARGHAYEAGGEVLFDTQSMPDYGMLSGRRLDEQQAGARIAVDAHKKHPTDFVLWKRSSDSEPGWESPWGRGRPGWHIECSAMSAAYLGETFDIHGGGLDLIFPHHENEIAQSRCAHGTHAMANIWMHNGFLQVEGEKMSKSTGNFVTIRELLRGWKGQAWSGPVVRWAMLQTHYRQPIDWTFDNLIAARDELWRLLMFADSIQEPLQRIEESVEPSPEIVSALSDDLSTSEAIFAIRQSGSEGGPKAEKLIQLLRNLMFLGVIRSESAHIFSTRIEGRDWPKSMASAIGNLGNNLRIARANSDQLFEVQLLERARAMKLRLGKQSPRLVELFYEGENSESFEALIKDRSAARARKDWKESDRIRDELLALGVVLKDGKDADGNPVTTWEIVR